MRPIGDAPTGAVMPGNNTYPGAAAAWAVVFMLAVAFILSFIDRQVLSLLVGPIRAAFQISDVRFSMLQGLAFAITYSLGGLPLGLWIDRGNRKRIIALAIIVWSVATVSCGLVQSFWELFAARVMVGIGEAALLPAAFSMIPDLFRRDRIATPMAVFMSGSTVGAGLALIFGSYALSTAAALNHWSFPGLRNANAWQITFLLVGSPGLILGLLILALVREPKRPAGHEAKDNARPKYRQVWAIRRFLIPMFLGFSCVTLTFHGTAAWVVEVFRRAHGWQPQHFGMVGGSIQIVSSLAGTFVGGVVIDHLHKRGWYDATMRVGIFVFVALIPSIALAMWLPHADAALAALGLVYFFFGMMLPAPGISLQVAVPHESLGLTTALMMMIVNLIGMGSGPTLVALATKHLFGSDLALPSGVAVVAAAALGCGALLLLTARPAPPRSLSALIS